MSQEELQMVHGQRRQPNCDQHRPQLYLNTRQVQHLNQKELQMVSQKELQHLEPNCHQHQSHPPGRQR